MSEKICILCQQDCSDAPRFVDEQGNYLHERCYHQDQEKQAEQIRSGLGVQASIKPKTNRFTTPKKSTETPRKQVSGSLKSLLFSIQGRIPRKIYWSISFPIIFITYLYFFIKVGNAFATLSAASESNPVKLDELFVFGAFDLVFWVLWIPVSTWVGIATAVKRFHDRDKSGWWLLLLFLQIIPFVGWLIPVWFFIELGFLRGSAGSNQFGPDPLR